ncbi:MAG: hypothetical protein GX215_04085 [Clostridiales Family XIII bacterium]|nr:hypothetical protein [Clostridiales Family XIII bacterium]
MPDGKIEGGYILLSRKIIESEIWRKPPLYLKVWIWLLERAQHKEYKQLKRGQLFASINDIRTGVAWYVGYRKETPTKDQIFQILEWMRNPYGSNMRATMKAPMIATTKATHGMVIEILNYEHYQNPKNYESNNESNDEPAMKTTRKQRQPNNINKNDKNDKNDKKYKIIRSPIEIAIDDFKEFRKKIKKPMTDRAVELLVDKLNKLASDDETKIAILNQSIVNGWQGVFPLKGDTQRQSGTNNPFLQEGV